MELKNWMIIDAANNSYKYGQDLAERNLYPSYERHAYCSKGYNAIPNWVLGLSIEDHEFIERLCRRSFKQGFRSKVK